MSTLKLMKGGGEKGRGSSFIMGSSSSSSGGGGGGGGGGGASSSLASIDLLPGELVILAAEPVITQPTTTTSTTVTAGATAMRIGTLFITTFRVEFVEAAAATTAAATATKTTKTYKNTSAYVHSEDRTPLTAIRDIRLVCGSSTSAKGGSKAPPSSVPSPSPSSQYEVTLCPGSSEPVSDVLSSVTGLALGRRDGMLGATMPTFGLGLAAPTLKRKIIQTLLHYASPTTPLRVYAFDALPRAPAATAQAAAAISSSFVQSRRGLFESEMTRCGNSSGGSLTKNAVTVAASTAAAEVAEVAEPLAMTITSESVTSSFLSCWAVTDVNVSFDLCSSYPPIVVIPMTVASESVARGQVAAAAACWQKGRFPVWCWSSSAADTDVASDATVPPPPPPFSPYSEAASTKRTNSTGAWIARASHPVGGVVATKSSSSFSDTDPGHSADSAIGIDYLSVAGDPISTALRNSGTYGPYVCLNTRFVGGAGAVAAAAAAAATFSMAKQPTLPASVAGEEVARNIGQCLMRLRKLCERKGPDADHWHALLASTGWLQRVGDVLSLAVKTAVLVSRRNTSVVLCGCAVGGDSDALVATMAMVMLDPYYRTLAGLRTLITKEWLAMGYPAGTRHVLRTRATATATTTRGSLLNEERPSLLLMLDCLHQILAQFPASFEYNQTLLMALFRSACSGRYGTFLLDSDAQRSSSADHARADCLWSALQLDYAVAPAINGSGSAGGGEDTRRTRCDIPNLPTPTLDHPHINRLYRRRLGIVIPLVHQSALRFWSELYLGQHGALPNVEESVEKLWKRAHAARSRLSHLTTGD